MQFRFVARVLFATAVVALACCDTSILSAQSGARLRKQRQFSYTTTNFHAVAPDPAFAKKIADEAERFRKELAVLWLGEELPTWREKCPIQVSLSPHSGGETSFAFMYNGNERGEPSGWDMKVYGTPERILDSVLPHEVTHTIFATHFRRPLPRWADEGACTTVEHSTEKRKNHGMLLQFLTSQPSRGIPFNRMFTMREYPRDILTLYAQGFSVAKFLIMKKGRRHFVDYVGYGMANERPGQETRAWDLATEKFYGYSNLSELQIRWERWVAQGSIETEIPGDAVVAKTAKNTLEPIQPKLDRPKPAPRETREGNLESLNQGWYTKQMRLGKRSAESLDRPSETPKSTPNIWR